MKKLLSVITVVKNDRPNALKTYESLKQYLGDKVEYIIQDYKGQSELSIDDDNVAVYTDEDTCIADAANMAVNKAKGKYILFWGAGEEALVGFAQALEQLETSTVDIMFNCIKVPGNDTVFKPSPENVKEGMSCLTPGAIISKDLFLKYGGIDIRYQIACDYEMFVKLLKLSQNYIVTDFPIVLFPVDGISSSTRALEGFIECELIRMREYQKAPVLAAMDLGLTCNTYVRQRTRISLV